MLKCGCPSVLASGGESYGFFFFFFKMSNVIVVDILCLFLSRTIWLHMLLLAFNILILAFDKRNLCHYIFLFLLYMLEEEELLEVVSILLT